MRTTVLAVALVFIAGFAFLTVVAATEQGVTVATVLSVFILVLLAVGIVGALRNPPRTMSTSPFMTPDQSRLRREEAARRRRKRRIAILALLVALCVGAAVAIALGSHSSDHGSRSSQGPSASHGSRGRKTCAGALAVRAPAGETRPGAPRDPASRGRSDPAELQATRRAPGCCSTSTPARCSGSATPTGACGSRA